jgi:histone chaperone ASF1
LEWKLTYVGSAEDDAHDQVLDTVLVGPVGVGSYKFVFQADPPDATKIPQSDVLGVTVLLLTCSYDGTEFIRVGYYVNNEYADEALREDPPATVRLDRVVRNILAEKPRVTRFPCEFDAPAIPAAGEMDEEETENQPVAAGGLHAAPADNAHDAHAYAQNGAQMLYGAAGAYAAAGYAAAGECAPADAGGAPLGAPHVGFGYGGAPAGHGLAEMQGARY